MTAADHPSVTDDARAEAQHTPACSAIWMAVGGCTCAEQKAAARAETTDERVVHNHGPTDGPGLDCPETILPDGGLRGACLNRAETTTEWAHMLDGGGASIHRTREAAEQAQRDYLHQQANLYPVDDLPNPPSAGIYRREVTEWKKADQ